MKLDGTAVDIVTASGSVRARAWEFGLPGLAITIDERATDARRYTITHIPSGYGLAAFRWFEQAMDACECVWLGDADWTQDLASIQADPVAIDAVLAVRKREQRHD